MTLLNIFLLSASAFAETLHFRSLISVGDDRALSPEDFWEEPISIPGSQTDLRAGLDSSADVVIIPLAYWQSQTGYLPESVIVGTRAAVVRRSSSVPADVLESFASWARKRNDGSCDTYTFQEAHDVSGLSMAENYGSGPWIWSQKEKGVWQWLDLGSHREGVLKGVQERREAVLKAVRSIEKDDQLVVSDYEISWLPFDHQSRRNDFSYHLSHENLSASIWIARQKVEPGDILTRVNLKRIPDVKAGDSVTMIWIRNNVTLQMAVRACHDAFKGEYLRVRSDTGRSFRGELDESQGCVVVYERN